LWARTFPAHSWSATRRATQIGWSSPPPKAAAVAINQALERGLGGADRERHAAGRTHAAVAQPIIPKPRRCRWADQRPQPALTAGRDRSTVALRYAQAVIIRSSLCILISHALEPLSGFLNGCGS
jgi:hypothetical protein